MMLEILFCLCVGAWGNWLTWAVVWEGAISNIFMAAKPLDGLSQPVLFQPRYPV